MNPLLGILQLTDSGFPSGAFTLSYGLETLVADGAVRSPDDVAALLQVSLLDRLARADLVVLIGVHGASGLDEVLELDRRLSTVKLAAGERTASQRVGRRLANEVSRLTPDALLASYVAAVDAGRTPGNAATALGLALRAFRVPALEAAVAAAWGFANGLCTAAVRLGLIGHGDAQRILRESGAVIEGAVAQAMAADPDRLRPSGPQLEVALARHEIADAHLFAT